MAPCGIPPAITQLTFLYDKQRSLLIYINHSNSKYIKINRYVQTKDYGINGNLNLRQIEMDLYPFQKQKYRIEFFFLLIHSPTLVLIQVKYSFLYYAQHR